MASRIRTLGWKAGCVGLALFAGTQAGRLQAAPQDDEENVVQASAVSFAIVDSLIEDAMEDGTISGEERRLIMGLARRRMNSTEIAEIESRIATLPAIPATIGSVTRSTTPGSIADDGYATANGNGNGNGNGSGCCDEPGCGGLFDNMVIFAASDGWKSAVDDDDNNNFGVRFGFNAGVPLDKCRGIGAQFGMSYGVYDFHGRTAGNETSAIEEQYFFTLGAFQRSDLCAECPRPLSWGIVYDHMITDNLGEDGWEIGLGQLRGQVGYALSNTNEVGLMGALRIDKQRIDGDSNNQDSVSSLDNISIYHQHLWCWSANTRTYIGIAEDPGSFVFGAQGEVPLSNCVSLFGGSQYILPSADGGTSGGQGFTEEYWNASVGVKYYPGGNAVSKSVSGRRWMPLLPVADNGSFSLDTNPNNL
jgi:hypothetical protein